MKLFSAPTRSHASPRPSGAAGVARANEVVAAGARCRAAPSRRCACAGAPRACARRKTARSFQLPSGGSAPMWWTDVTPCAATWRIAASSAASSSAAVGGGTDALDQRHRAIFKQAGRLAVSVAHDRAAVDVRRGTRDARQLQGARVGERHMAVDACQPDRMIRRDRVDPLARRPRAAPSLVIPVAAENPRIARPRRGERRAGSSRTRRDRRRPPSATHPRRKPPAIMWMCASMNPGVTSPPAASISRARPAARDRMSAVVPTPSIESPSQQHRLGPWPRRVAGPDARVDDGAYGLIAPIFVAGSIALH